MAPARRRVIISTRVMPSTLEYLEQMACDTPGRAIDLIVRSMVDQGIAKLLMTYPAAKLVQITG